MPLTVSCGAVKVVATVLAPPTVEASSLRFKTIEKALLKLTLAISLFWETL